MEKRYILVCKQCGEEFESGNDKKALCDSCREENRRIQQERQRVANKKPTIKPAKPRPTADIELMHMVRIIDRYNEQNGTHYSYGKFMQLIADKKIDWRKEIKNA